MTPPLANLNIIKRINMLTKAKAWFLEGTEAYQAIEDYVTTTNPTLADLNDLRISLDDYKDNVLTGNNVTLYNALNTVLTSVENEYFFERIGLTELSKSATRESFDNGGTYVTTITSLIGPHDISGVSASDDNTITGVIGNEALPEITLLNITTEAASSISEELNVMANAVSNAIGRSALAISGPLTLSECQDGILTTIYDLPETTSLVDAFNGMLACSNWAINTANFGLNNDENPASCYYSSADRAFSDCMYYLSGEQILLG
jgi:hypothetical protein